MNFEAWLKNKGFDPLLMSSEQLTAMRTLYEIEQKQTAAVPVAQPVAQPVQQPARADRDGNPAPAPAAQPAIAGQASFDEKMQAIEAEGARIEYIRESAARAAQAHVGNPEKVKQLRELADAAIADQKMDARAFDLALLRLDRAMGPMVLSPRRPEITQDVVEAAVCVAGGLRSAEKEYPDQVLEAAHRHFRGGMGLQQLLLVSARRNGFRGESFRGNERTVLRHAFRVADEGLDLRAGGPSTYDLSGILSNVANKFLREAFLAVETAWREIAAIRNVSDFKEISSYSLTGDNQYEQIAPGGKIKHGTLGERSYTNRADSYGKMLGIDRRDLINDDLGAFTGANRRLGRGGALKINDVFWTEWLDDSTFFPTDKSLSNYDDGATDSVLSLAGLENADLIFRQQTDPDGKPLGVMPAILLVPVTLRVTALNLMASTLTAAAQSTATVGLTNVWQNMFRVVSSTYLSNSSYTGYSTTAWYLLADPNDLPAIEVCFLNGQEMPTVETAEADFDTLGIAIRGYHDFGARKQEYRAAVKLKGAA